MKLDFLDRVWRNVQILNFMKIFPVEADGRTDGRTDNDGQRIWQLPFVILKRA
jgi:hypothetical protein